MACNQNNPRCVDGVFKHFKIRTMRTLALILAVVFACMQCRPFELDDNTTKIVNEAYNPFKDCKECDTKFNGFNIDFAKGYCINECKICNGDCLE